MEAKDTTDTLAHGDGVMSDNLCYAGQWILEIDNSLTDIPEHFQKPIKKIRQKTAREIVHKSQHCNRNWDLSKAIPQEDIDLIVESAVHCPAKQNLNFYKTHVITNRDMIEKICSHTKGFELNGKLETNSQTLANLLLVFTKDQPNAKRDEAEIKHGNDAYSYRDDRLQATGIAAGYAILVSTMLGYDTGCCKCFTQKSEITKELNGEEPLLMVGIGYPDSNRSRLEHHNDPSIIFPSFSNKRQFVVHA